MKDIGLRIERSHPRPQNDELKSSYTEKFYTIRGRGNILNENIQNENQKSMLHTKYQVTSKVSGIRLHLDFLRAATEAKRH